ncbi:glycosyltransferase family 2 protein [Massilia luteola]|uniref:glycosyltransferase family 2 protein n=1 Tax=Massilia luteola TaxID=3081751 RepID=UPI002ACC3062|nr:glycosyltransferase [Massilia sp. Gc5]
MALVSVVIPTKNRAQYARWTINACLKLGDQCEVVVADSAADDSLLNTLREHGLFDKIVYVRTSPDFSVVDNFNEAIRHASGQFVTCVGDDDIVTSAVMDVANYALWADVEAVTFSFPLTYWWPDFVHRRRGTFDSATIGAGAFAGAIKQLDPRRELKRAAAKLGTGPQNMPRIYAGLIRRSLLERIEQKYGTLFGGVSPDVYSSTLLACECRSLIHVDYPVIVPGLSGGSTSGTSSNGTHLGKLRENSHIAPFRNLIWDERVPEYYSVPTVWSFSMLKALERTDKVDLANFFNLYLKCALYTRGYGKDIRGPFKAYIRRRNLGMIVDVAKSALAEAGYVFGAVWRRISERMSGSQFIRYDSFENSKEAADRIEQIIAERPFAGAESVTRMFPVDSNV